MPADLPKDGNPKGRPEFVWPPPMTPTTSQALRSCAFHTGKSCRAVVGADDTGLCGQFSRCVLTHDMGFMYELSIVLYFFYFTYDIGFIMRRPFRQVFFSWNCGSNWTRSLGLPGKYISKFVFSASRAVLNYFQK